VASNGFSFTFQGIAGVIYVVEYKTDFAAASWIELERRHSAGGMELVTDPSAGDAMRLYRVRALYAAAPSLSRAAVAVGTVSFDFPTVPGAKYVVQYKTNLNDSAWFELFRQTGTGAPIVVNDPTAAEPSRFYRVKVE